MYDRHVWEATPGNTLFHKIDVRTKLVLLLLLAAMVLLVDSPRSLFLLFCLVLSLHLLARSSMGRWRILMVFILLGIWGSMTSQALFYSSEPRTIIACLVSPAAAGIGALTGGVYVYREGLEYGAVQALRSGTMLALGLLINWTSDPRQLLRSLLAWKLPYELGFMLITGLRFLPVIFQETGVVLTAQRLRGFNPFRTISPRRLIQTAFQTLFPILARTLRRAATLASSVESRGFGREIPQVPLPVWSCKERLVCHSLLLTVVGLILLKIMDSLQFNGFLYVSSLRGVYDLMKVWL
ncbi:energy-coupling factor transporter transmembrane component T family protein [Sporomusa sphaeroides]|jgi:energy-coupling factor transport system permease protein|uniref:energy-coupling factor transporter transmembrane component T family protein n=1 Tax=Sporomusa sphaeroides TaxID=47679 RepID=UPI002D1C79D9|nr:energy-coupling factor transporter transmembrane component T [Sporomusa sphaeroides]HML31798.1 energy-coupling factor transporter transmembrane component T [Sporomusa sphaeroides]